MDPSWAETTNRTSRLYHGRSGAVYFLLPTRILVRLYSVRGTDIFTCEDPQGFFKPSALVLSKGDGAAAAITG